MSNSKIRREKLFNILKGNYLIIFCSGKSPIKSADESYEFTPNRNFYYFSDLDIENAFLVMQKVDGQTNEKLFIERNDPVLARWIGEKASKEFCSQKSGLKVEDVLFLDEFINYLGNTLSRNDIEEVFLNLKRVDWESSSKEVEISKEISKMFPYIIIKDISKVIYGLRMLKDEDEIKNIKYAIEITKDAFLNLIKNSQSGMYEYELQAYFDFVLRKNGVKDYAFKPIIASGINSTILHYSDNSSKTEEGDLVLLDLGAQYNYYSADISRTFPISRKFNTRQKDVYNVVLTTMKEIERQARPGLTLFDLNEIAKKCLADGCKKLGLIESSNELSNYYFHSVSHFLGLDTHDVGDKNTELKPGMVITNEPGLYITKEKIGIRIEDDLLITEDGCENLSKDIPREIEDIEKLWSM
ncbi:aminopeptidase P family protein [Petrotoga sp. 9PWA.NaAc.5.4]|uniref:aminopeptidase P family protein n=1 Tax=Petrotoga sp. 9PWA.NaAc.5.4 TaxID=1434328 RepID=UPI000CCA9029|nr:aminopeptidase P family protein [Petrotoga sp. 9PWA.NaAc.5.4]PNR93665.1 peptidase M24 [Petrotoga sp. 9PWA.NaAc.5.4]